jgi:hypothetical protein
MLGSVASGTPCTIIMLAIGHCPLYRLIFFNTHDILKFDCTAVSKQLTVGIATDFMIFNTHDILEFDCIAVSKQLTVGIATDFMIFLFL